jgi:hypothetical protein
MRKILAMLGLIVVTSCQTGTDALNVDDVRKSELVTAECAIYFSVEAKLASEGRSANGNMSEGCAESGPKTADIAPINPPKQLDSRYATLLYQRMIARGMPKDVADGVRTSNAFYNLVVRNDEVYGRR